MNGIDLIYRINPDNIKEYIVINENVGINEFTFEYKVNHLELVLNDDGEIEAKNSEGEIIFIMPKPYMYDANGEYCHDVGYEITQKNKKYTITVVANQEWLVSEDRSYPIVIDPVIYSKQTQNVINTTFITSGWSNTNYQGIDELLVGRETLAYDICRTLFKFDLNHLELNRGDMVIEAKFCVLGKYASFLNSTVPDLQVNAHMITKSWEEDTVTWNSIATGVGVDGYYESTILDYDFIERTDVSNLDWKVFDITSAVKRWLSGEANNGILLKTYNEVENDENLAVKGCFYSEDYNNVAASYPYIALVYRSNKGIENYYNYTTFSTYSAGTVYIDNYSGNLVVSRIDASTPGTRLPVTISHIYNGYMSGENNNTSRPYVGYGWKLNLHQNVKTTNLTDYPYVYMDGDGTEHYFVLNDSKYIDEDGLGLTLEVTDSGYTITDKSDSMMIFDSNGLLSNITDNNGNTITVSTDQELIYLYASGGNGKSLVMETDYLGELQKIYEVGEFKGPATSPNASLYTAYDYTSGLLTQITSPDKKVTHYEYDSDNALKKMISCDGTAIEFDYTSLASGKQVSAVREYGSDGSLGQTLLFDRSEYNKTIITSSGIDEIIGTADDAFTELQFDNGGRLIATHAYTGEEELGASVMEYTGAEPNSENSDIQQLNRITKVGSLGKNVENLLLNHNVETLNNWEVIATGASRVTKPKMLFGSRGIDVTVSSNTANGFNGIYQTIDLTNIQAGHQYTFSAYVDVESATAINGAENYGVALMVDIEQSDSNTQYISEYISIPTDLSVNNGWRRISVTFTAPADMTNIDVCAGLYGARGSALFDGFQLEESSIPNTYNVLLNGSFETDITSWIKESGTSSDGMIGSSIAQHGSRVLKFAPSVGSEKKYFQSVRVDANQEDTYIVSGWAYGEGMTKKYNADGEEEGNRKFEIGIKVNYTDGTDIEKEPVDFSHSISGWQYGAKMFDLSDPNNPEKVPTSVQIYLISSGQVNEVYFDNIHLTKSKVTENKYNDDGQLISSDGVTYTYDENGNLQSVTDKEGKVTQYTYDSKKNPLTTTTNSGILNETTYDTYGNVTSSQVSHGDLKTLSTTGYDTTNSFLTSMTDLHGNTTTYAYNTTKGLINSVTNAKGVTTSYTYNKAKQLLSTTSGTVTQSNSYDSVGRLSSITSDGAVYGFTFDVYGNRASTTVGNTTLATYTYNNYNGSLSEVTLANNQKYQYEYDHFGNITYFYENGICTSKDEYDSTGTLLFSYDYKNQTKKSYDYDLKGQLIRISVFDLNATGFEDGKLCTYEYGYDDTGKVVKQLRMIGSRSQSNTISYGADNEIVSVVDEGSKAINFSYDALKRATQKVIATNDENITLSYVYADSQNLDGYTTEDIQSETFGDFTYTYTYDCLGNITQIVLTKGQVTQYTIDYVYDDNSQLIRENNSLTNKTIEYIYDTSGNITSQKTYAYTTGTLGTPNETVTYSYGNENWKDQLTSYNGQAIAYDEIGNPENYLGNTMTWNGRELLSITNEDGTINYSYDSGGIRTGKTVDQETTNYEYIDGQLVHEKRSDCDLYYRYDEGGFLYKITYIKNNVTTNYYVTTNIRGDVEAIYDKNGSIQARYNYGSWGEIISIVDANGSAITSSTHIGLINPIRYRGYYYDNETGYYYLGSRYYNPTVHRFINADGTITSNQSMVGSNAYAYCFNNPVNHYDEFGEITRLLLDKIVHNLVLEDICKKNKEFCWRNTCIYYNKENCLGGWGFCDLYNSNTGEVWELKKMPEEGKRCSKTITTEYALKQLERYTNGRLRSKLDKPLKKPDSPDPFMQKTTFDKTVDGYHLEISYWSEGNGILRYSYTKKETTESKVAKALLIAAIGIGLGVGAAGSLPLAIGSGLLGGATYAY